MLHVEQYKYDLLRDIAAYIKTSTIIIRIINLLYFILQTICNYRVSLAMLPCKCPTLPVNVPAYWSL